MSIIHCYGVIPFQKSKEGNLLVFLIHRNEGFWEFPKGHSERDESPLEAAKRELFEETGLQVRKLILDQPLSLDYEFQKEGVTFQKKVTYFVCEVEGKIKLQLTEVQEGRFFTTEEALKVLTFKNSREFFSLLLEKLQD